MEPSTRLKFGITVLFVRNFAKCFRFYKDALGLKVAFANLDHEVAEFKVGNRRMLLHGGHKGKPSTGPLHVHFQVGDIRKTVKLLQKRGVKFKYPVEKRSYGVYETSFSDPEGNEFDLIQPF